MAPVGAQYGPPPPGGAQYGPPPPGGMAPPPPGGAVYAAQQQQPTTYLVQGGFDAGARFDGISKPNIPVSQSVLSLCTCHCSPPARLICLPAMWHTARPVTTTTTHL